MTNDLHSHYDAVAIAEMTIVKLTLLHINKIVTILYHFSGRVLRRHFGKLFKG